MDNILYKIQDKFDNIKYFVFKHKKAVIISSILVFTFIVIGLIFLMNITAKEITPDKSINSFSTVEELNAAYPNGADTPMLVGTAKYEWKTDPDGWVNSDNSDMITYMKGKDGIDGADGQNGKSAYDLAVDNGYSGTLEEWLNDIQGRTAFELDVQNGFNGSFEEWKDSLRGKDGKNGVNGKNGTDGKIGVDGKNGQDGQNGKSAYDLDVEKGYTGTLNDWLNDIQGEDAYELYIANGGTYTYPEWEKSLRGKKGDDGEDGEDGRDGKNGKDGISGKDGQDGENGKDAYELYVAENGDKALSKDEWLLTLNPYELAKALNPKIKTTEDYYESLTAYGVYKFGLADPSAAMSKADWLASLKGEQGEKGADGTDGRDG